MRSHSALFQHRIPWRGSVFKRNSIGILFALIAAVVIFASCSRDTDSPITQPDLQSEQSSTQTVVQETFTPGEGAFAPEAGMMAPGTPCDLFSPALATFTLPSGTVDLMAGTIDTTTGDLILNVRWPNESTCRMIRMYVETDDPEWGGFTAESINSGTQFKVSFLWSTTAEGKSRVLEATPTDTLFMESTPESSNLTKETYVYNGVSQSWTFDASTAASDATLASEWAAFYPSSSTLNDNLDGQRLVELIDHPGFLAWCESEFNVPSDRGFPIPWTICSLLKCTFLGGWANPICHACTGMSIAYEVADIICWMVPWCDEVQ
jgi:hypothetical protein